MVGFLFVHTTNNAKGQFPYIVYVALYTHHPAEEEGEKNAFLPTKPAHPRTERGDRAIEGRVHWRRRKAFHYAGGLPANLPRRLLDDGRGAAVGCAVGAYHGTAPLTPAGAAGLLTAHRAVAHAGDADRTLRGRCTKGKCVFLG